MTSIFAEPARREPRALEPIPLGLPSGWFMVAASAELSRGRTLTRRFMSEDLVLYRTASGEARAVSAYCPHLGAHLGHAGAVEGDSLRCAFHGFCFDGRGACVKTAYGTRPPPAARLPVRRVREMHGVLLVHHDPSGAAPAWDVPEPDVRGWAPFVLQRLTLRGHPQETSENSVDVGHFATIHGYHDVRTVEPARAEGPSLRARYAMKRPVWPLGRLGAAFDTEFDVHVHGLGYSLVDVRSHGVSTRHLVCATPTDPGRIDLHLGAAVDGRSTRSLALAKALSRGLAVMFRHDVQQDFRIWEHKRFVARPPLAEGDGPVPLFRKWAAQFYPA